jgi:GNAT superfamily N-acetyltransferase
MPKSENYWHWKHVDNPFGSSQVLLALDDENVVGVRAFMHWKWQHHHEIINTVRAVDTATHPDYQGKGIFRSLTQKLAEQSKQNGVHFIFNTPNDKSKPGYLKMGWEVAGKLPIGLKIIKPFGMVRQIISPRQSSHNWVNETLSYYLNHPGLSALLISHQSNFQNKLVTMHTAASLRWRYMDVPVVNYFGAGIEDKGLKACIIFRLKSTRLGNELRITDVMLESEIYLTELRRLIKQEAKKHEADYVSITSFMNPDVLSGILSFSSLSVGPTVTVRNLNMNEFGKLKNFKGWSPSMGDLELF